MNGRAQSAKRKAYSQLIIGLCVTRLAKPKNKNKRHDEKDVQNPEQYDHPLCIPTESQTSQLDKD